MLFTEDDLLWWRLRPHPDARLRADVPWYQTIGPDYVARAFHVAHAADPAAVLVLNDFGFEVDDDFAVAADKRRAALDLIDAFQHERVPIHALGVQAHLDAKTFYGFDPVAYQRFLSDVASRGLKILLTELDVLDDGLPADQATRDGAVADIYTRYLHAALAEPAVRAVMTFGLSDRYTWLQEDEPAARRRGAPSAAVRHASTAKAGIRRPAHHAGRRSRAAARMAARAVRMTLSNPPLISGVTNWPLGQTA